ncbi:MAG: carbohydrate kinase family protein [Steroidobacteraceae bacterium]
MMGSDAQRLTIIGDIGVDLVLGPLSGWPRVGTETILEQSELRAGGSAGNAALAVSYLGGASRLLSGVGNDDLGGWLSERFRGMGASLEVCDAPTTLSVGLIHTCSERTFFTTRGHLEKLSYELLRPQLTPAPHPNSIALLSGVFLTPTLRDEYPRLLRELNALGYRVALDTNWPPQNWGSALRAEVLTWIAQCEHVLLNELEVASLVDSQDLTVAIDRLTPMLKPGATLVVKIGSRGAIGVQGGHRFDCAAPPATAIFDTIGAGDSFNAGYLLARLNGCDLAASLAAGCSTASTIIARFPRRSIGRGELAGQLAMSGRAPAQESQA